MKATYNLKPLIVKGTPEEGEKLKEIPKFEFKIHAKRKIQYYLWKVLLPLTIIVFMSWSVFWLRPTDKVQINIATTAVLTSIAYLFILSRFLPPISYLTIMDSFVFISLVLIFMAFFNCRDHNRVQIE